MPRQKQDMRRDLRDARFSERQGKADHTMFSHPLVRRHVAVDGKDGADAEPFDETNLRRARRELEEAKRRQQP
jgi:hypothetical protein